MPDHSQSFVISIAQALNSAQVPCVLWGDYLLNVHGIPSILGSIDFVIPDALLEVGMNTLTQTHFNNLTPCSDTQVCPSSSPKRPTPPPAFHMHIEDSEVTVALYPQSETLWFLPPLDRSFLGAGAHRLELPDSSPFVLASDQTILPPRRPGRGSGVFKSDQNHVIVPKAHIMLEAFLRLYARDEGKWRGAFAMHTICYVNQYIDDDGLLDTSLLPEPLETFYKELMEGKKPVRQWTKELKKSLGVLDVDDSEDDGSP